MYMLSYSGFPAKFWSSTFSTTVYLINRLPTPTLNSISSFENLFSKPPNYINLKSFGCLCYPWLRPYTTNNLVSRSTPCVFLGYLQTQSGFKCYDPVNGKTYSLHHVVFVSHIFPYQSHVSFMSPPTMPSDIVSPSPSITLSHHKIPFSSTFSMHPPPNAWVTPLSDSSSSLILSHNMEPMAHPHISPISFHPCTHVSPGQLSSSSPRELLVSSADLADSYSSQATGSFASTPPVQRIHGMST